MVKRILSGIVGIILLFLVFFWNNLVIINIAVTAVALLALWEFYHAFKNKGHKPVEWLRLYSYSFYYGNWFCE